jgi:amino acid adenylation domain-containing protein
MLRRSECQAVIVGEEGLDHIEPVLADHPEPLLVLLPDLADSSAHRNRWPRHTVLSASELEPPDGIEVAETIEPGRIAYLLFTSGSTGVPKGVMVAHENVRAFAQTIADRYETTEEDRFSQVADLTFDASVFDLYVAWERGSCLCCPTQAQLKKPGAWVRDRRLTVWFSVPSLGLVMKRLGMLAAGAYPTLRWSVFCGEPLPDSLAADWAIAAPNSTVENIYGPTEVTVACTAYRWSPQTSPAEAVHGLVPIGEPLTGMSELIVDSDGTQADFGESGELLMSGPQVALGYWRDPEKTAAAFVEPLDRVDIHYRTGDLVRREGPNSPMVFMGRIDSQVKIGGYRVEMAEVEGALRAAAGTEEAVAVAWPRTESSASGITAFVQGEEADPRAIRKAMSANLPTYMVPKVVHRVDRLPLNANGKFDREALVKRLDAGASD